MIKSIHISKTASFGSAQEEMLDLATLNFIYGGNGTGKTTISRILARPDDYPNCSVTWTGNSPLLTLVYNHDFVEKNLRESNELKGVFTLGEDEASVLDEIARVTSEREALAKDINMLESTLYGTNGSGGKQAELDATEKNLREDCWKLKQKYDQDFSAAFEGHRHDKKSFSDRILRESTRNKAKLETLENLKSRAAIVYGPPLTPQASLSAIDYTDLIAHESNPLLAKVVVGRSDVDIAGMIEKLSNSDWVRQGREYLAISDPVCPFCQQEVPAPLSDRLNEYFDESFASDVVSIEELISEYKEDSEAILTQLQVLTENAPEHLNRTEVENLTALVQANVTANFQALEMKLAKPSITTTLTSLQADLDSINQSISSANTKIAEHNKTASNLKSERDELTDQVWRFLLDEMQSVLAAYTKKVGDLNKAIANIKSKIAAANEGIKSKTDEITTLESKVSSIQPTITAINSYLDAFGFRGFKLDTADDGSSYKLVRPDGSDARESLSEGEKTFVSFLYFLEKIKGSESKLDTTTPRVVVVDDPISSLDSDILFIVSSLMGGLFEEALQGTGPIRQVVSMTHNVFYHRETTYGPDKIKNGPSKPKYWVVRKPDGQSAINHHEDNPVSSSYELLWEAAKSPSEHSGSVQNSLRRILESYFKLLGGIEVNGLPAHFTGQDKIVCKSLCSWVHSGSHFVNEDLFVAGDEQVIAAYLRVFRAIFDVTGHLPHYAMMMGEEHSPST